MQSKPNLLGLHILLTLETQQNDKLISYDAFRIFLTNLLAKHKLQEVGNSFYIFENKSFTSAICLMESHLCIHTWPEINQLTADVYLCNYSQDNTEKVKKISKELITYFDAIIINKTEVER